MLKELSGEARGAAAPLVERWNSFKAKVSQRADAVVAEGDEGIDEVIAADPLNPNAVSTAFSALESRFHGLGTKVSEAEEKIEAEWDEACDDFDDEGDQRVLRRLWSGIVNESRALQRDIERKKELISIKKNADWARVLRQFAEREWGEPRACGECDAPISVPTVHAASSVNCGHCNAVNSIEVGMATGLYFQGTGVHALASEASQNEWLAEWQAEHDFNELLHPTSADRQRYHDAARIRWTSYYTAFKGLHPGYGPSLEEAVQAKLAHYTAWDFKSEDRERDLFGDIVKLAAAQDRQGLIAAIQSGGDVDVDDCICAVHERGDRTGTTLLLDIQYQLDDEDEPKQEWIAEKLAELDEDLANR
jgi:hypothetical protein